MTFELIFTHQDLMELSAEKRRALGILLGCSETGLSENNQEAPVSRLEQTANHTQTPSAVPVTEYTTMAQTTPEVPAASAPAPGSVPAQVPTSVPAYTLEQLQAALGPLLSSGRGAELQSLLTKYQVASMTELAAAQYGAFAADIRAMGAQI